MLGAMSFNGSIYMMTSIMDRVVQVGCEESFGSKHGSRNLDDVMCSAQFIETGGANRYLHWVYAPRRERISQQSRGPGLPCPTVQISRCCLATRRSLGEGKGKSRFGGRGEECWEPLLLMDGEALLICVLPSPPARRAQKRGPRKAAAKQQLHRAARMAGVLCLALLYCLGREGARWRLIWNGVMQGRCVQVCGEERCVAGGRLDAHSHHHHNAAGWARLGPCRNGFLPKLH